jgi:hypothetical protein
MHSMVQTSVDQKHCVVLTGMLMYIKLPATVEQCHGSVSWALNMEGLFINLVCNEKNVYSPPFPEWGGTEYTEANTDV